MIQSTSKVPKYFHNIMYLINHRLPHAIMGFLLNMFELLVLIYIVLTSPYSTDEYVRYAGIKMFPYLLGTAPSPRASYSHSHKSQELSGFINIGFLKPGCPFPQYRYLVCSYTLPLWTCMLYIVHLV